MSEVADATLGPVAPGGGEPVASISARAQFDQLTAVGRRSGLALAIMVAGGALAYASQVLLARWMGVSEFGQYAYLIAWSSVLATPAGLGLSSAVLRFIPEYSAQGDWSRLRGMMAGSWRLTLAASIVLCASATLLLCAVRPRGVVLSSSLLVGIWTVPLWALLRLQTETSRAFNRIVLAYIPTNVVFHLLIIGECYAQWVRTHSLSCRSALGLVAVALLVILIVQLALLLRGLPTEVFRNRPTYETREWLSVSIQLLFIQGFLVILNQTGILMAGVMLDSQAVANYTVAARTASLVSFVGAAVNTIAAPMIVRAHVQKDRQRLQRLAAAIAHCSFWPSLAGVLLLIVLRDRILGLFGPGYSPAAGATVILALGQLVTASAGSTSYLLNLTGHQARSAQVYGCCTVINIVLNAVGMILFGIVGAAAAMVLTTVLLNLWLHSLVVKRLGLVPSMACVLRRGSVAEGN